MDLLAPVPEPVLLPEWTQTRTSFEELRLAYELFKSGFVATIVEKFRAVMRFITETFNAFRPEWNRLTKFIRDTFEKAVFYSPDWKRARWHQWNARRRMQRSRPAGRYHTWGGQ